jgi:hypothetical protein
MKRLIRLFAAAVLVLAFINAVNAQNSRQEKKTAEQAAVKNMVADNNFFFVADYAIPMHGGSKLLTSIYDLKISKDSIIAFLPYYGQAYLSPAPGETEGGIKFTSTKFNYKVSQAKKGGWEIVITPADHNITDWRDVQQLRLNISPDGYASLFVNSSNRDPISFEGNVVAKE